MLAETGIPGDGKKGILYLTLRCHHQNDFCIKTGSDESRVYVSLILRVNSQDDVYKSQADVFLICLCVCVYVTFVCVCVRACVRACVRVSFCHEKGKPNGIRTEVRHLTSLTPYR